MSATTGAAVGFDTCALRSLLFVPALSPHLAERAHERGADALIVDLEDSIAPQRKAEARQAAPAMCTAFAARGVPTLIRVNADAALLSEDLRAAAESPVVAVMLPKVEAADAVRAARARLDALAPGRSIALVPLIETPRGLLQAEAIAGCDAGLAALGFGAGDLSVSMGVEASATLCEPAAWRIAVAAHAHGLAAWGVTGGIDHLGDLDGLRESALRARAMGYTGTPVVHPTQVAVANEVFGVTDSELAAARRVVDAWEAMLARGDGVARLDGLLLEAPFARRAMRTLERALRQRRSEPKVAPR
jgi:citrate lyase subunit beta/citryl-CoA lyase